LWETLLKLLALLVVLTMRCGDATGVNVSLATAGVDDGEGY